MAPSPSFSSHQAHCEDIWPFDELIADGEMDPINRLASFELRKTNESDKFQSLEREREILRNIQKWLASPPLTSPCDPSYASVDFGLPVVPSYDLAKSRPPPKPNYPARKPRLLPKPNYYH